MSKLLKSHRQEIVKRIVADVRAPREARLRERERHLAVKLVRWRYGDDVFDKARALPEGWLPNVKYITLNYRLRTKLTSGSAPWRLELDTAVPLPWSASHEWTDFGKIHDEVYAWYQDWTNLEEELRLLRQQTEAVLSTFTTVERLAADWPEGYAMLPAEQLAPSNGLPAPRISDLNARIAALKEAA